MLSCLRLCSQSTKSNSISWKLCTRVFNNIKSKSNIRLTKTAHKETVRTLRNNVGVRIFAGISTATVLRFLQVAHCDAGQKVGTRLEGSITKETDPSFNWIEFWKLLQPFIRELIGAIVASLACAALSIYIPRILGDIINVVSSHISSSAEPFLQEIKGPALRLVALYGCLSVATFLYIHFLTTVGEGVAESLKNRLFSNILRQDIAFFDSHRTGELINRLTVDISDFKSAFKMVVSQGLRNVTQALGCTVTLLSISPQMTGLMLVAVPSIILVGTLLGIILRALANKVTQNRLVLSSDGSGILLHNNQNEELLNNYCLELFSNNKMSLDAKAQNAKLTLLADEALGNMRTVRAFAMEDLEIRMFEEQAARARLLNERLGIGIAAFQAGTTLFLNGMVLSTLYVGGRLLSDQEISPGSLMSFLVALQMLQRSFTQLSLLFGTYIKGLHAGARVFEMLDAEPTMNLESGKKISYHSLLPEIEFRDVTFAYPTRPARSVLKNFSLKIPVGKTVALVGTSGGGKSTVAWLLERLYDVDEGAILVGGIDVRELNPKWLRGRVLGLISQEPVLFATTVMENIRYGRPDATDAEVLEASKLANADEFIRRFPDGYKTLVGERGVAVSGGQKQRIAIARALLKNPSVLILDEATSALDTESEQLVQAALDKIMEKRTTIVIAHRLSTIQNADLIVVINNGNIVESGNHKELMAKNGIYASFVQQQKLSGKA